MSTQEMIDYVVEEKFPIFTPEVRSIIYREFIPCILDRTLPRDVFDEIFEECNLDVVATAHTGARSVYDYANDGWVDDIDEYYEATKLCLLDALNFRDELADQPADELKSLYKTARIARAGRRKESLLRQELLAFFHDAEAAADYEYWSAIPVVRSEEATALSLGKDPRFVTQASLAEHLETGSPFAIEFEDRLRRVDRAVEAGVLVAPIRTAKFAGWALKHLTGDASFEDWCTKVAALPTAPTSGEADTRAVGFAVAKLLAGMAISKYGLSQTYGGNDKSEVFQDIVNDLATVHLDIDVKSVRKHLVDALKLLHERGDFKKVAKPLMPPVQR